MKKLALALVCLVSVAFFASCQKPVENPEPSIAVIAQDGYVADGDTVNLDENIIFGFNVASNVETNKELQSLVVKVDDTEWANIALTGNSYSYTDTVVYSVNAKDIIGQSVISAIVTDVDGKTATATITLNINQNVEPLICTPINWVRKGANIIEGETQLANLGLEWAGSYKEVFATFKPASGYILYKFDADWNDINTVDDVAELFNPELGVAEIIPSFREITTNNSSDYDAIIGTVKIGESAEESEIHLMHITHCAVENLASEGTKLTITGEAKN